MQLRDLLFPKLCLSCGRLGSYICLKCAKELVYVRPDKCFYCGKSSYLGLTHPACKRSKGVAGFISIYYYNNTLKKIIKNIKYRLVLEAYDELVKIINFEILADKLQCFKKIKKNVVLCPIPLHLQRLKKRGFNQSELLAKFFSKFTNIPVKSILKRVKNTRPQAQIKVNHERKINMKSAFKINDNWDKKKNTVILVDDLVTSGSTVKEAVSALKEGDISQIFVLTLARG